MGEQENGERHRARIVEAIEDQEDDLGRNPTRVKFKLSVNGKEWDDLVAYNQVIDYICQQEQDPIYWKFRRIVSHQGPLKRGDPDYNGSKWNILVEWENGE